MLRFFALFAVCGAFRRLAGTNHAPLFRLFHDLRSIPLAGRHKSCSAFSLFSSFAEYPGDRPTQIMLRIFTFFVICGASRRPADANNAPLFGLFRDLRSISGERTRVRTASTATLPETAERCGSGSVFSMVFGSCDGRAISARALRAVSGRRAFFMAASAWLASCALERRSQLLPATPLAAPGVSRRRRSRSCSRSRSVPEGSRRT